MKRIRTGYYKGMYQGEEYRVLSVNGYDHWAWWLAEDPEIYGYGASKHVCMAYAKEAIGEKINGRLG